MLRHGAKCLFIVFTATLTISNGGLDSIDGDAASQESFDIQASLKKKKKFTGELPQLVEHGVLCMSDSAQPAELPQLVEPSLEHRVLCLE